ncbi:hypothetical protein MCETHM1_03382 [Flavobacteriaceae bacterium]
MSSSKSTVSRTRSTSLSPGILGKTITVCVLLAVIGSPKSFEVIVAVFEYRPVAKTVAVIVILTVVPFVKAPIVHSPVPELNVPTEGVATPKV